MGMLRDIRGVECGSGFCMRNRGSVRSVKISFDFIVIFVELCVV